MKWQIHVNDFAAHFKPHQSSYNKEDLHVAILLLLGDNFYQYNKKLNEKYYNA